MQSDDVIRHLAVTACAFSGENCLTNQAAAFQSKCPANSSTRPALLVASRSFPDDAPSTVNFVVRSNLFAPRTHAERTHCDIEKPSLISFRPTQVIT